MNRLCVRLATLAFILGLTGCDSSDRVTDNARGGLTAEQEKNHKDLAAQEAAHAKSLKKETKKQRVLGP